jgi:alpha-tubulin suppressor-like RCC1 family protein
VLTDQGYLYAWGRGFEGQLGLSETIEVASVPAFVKFFHKMTVKHIAAGDCYSLAVTDAGEMFSWGEAKMGQLGLGRFREVRTPRQIEFPEQAQIKTCAAGFGHTVALAENGNLYSWGFNTYGQVGLGDKKTHWQPT